MANTANFSRGDSFGCTWTWNPGEGEPADLLDTTITSTIRDHCGNEYPLVVTIAEDGLSFSTIYDGDTSDWGLGQANWDIRFVFDGNPIAHSTIFRVIIADTITQS
jgi:hypothetical protein